MGHGVRKGLGRGIPWLALVVVSVFAFSQLRARNEARSDLARARDDLKALETAGTASSAAAPAPEVPGDASSDPRVQALDDALVREREDHAATRARVLEFERAVAAERERGDRIEAVRATEAARSRALEARVAEWQDRVRSLEQESATLLEDAKTRAAEYVETLQSLKKEVEVLRAGARRLAVAGPVLTWLDDVASKDAARIDYARARAQSASPEQVEALLHHLGQSREKDGPASQLAAFLPESATASRIVGELALRAPAEDLRLRLDALGDALLRVDILQRVFTQGGPGLCRALVARAAAQREAWSEEERRQVGSALAGRLSARHPEVVASGAHGLGVLALGGHADVLAAHLADPSPAVRAAAAYALSRVPDLDPAREPARARLLPLLADADRDVRTAGVLLAERLVGERLAFDPGATPELRAEALERLKTRLGL